jgi:hypothetical protein
MPEDVPVRQVRDVMTTVLVTVDAEDGVDRLVELFEMHGFNLNCTVIPFVTMRTPICHDGAPEPPQAAGRLHGR